MALLLQIIGFGAGLTFPVAAFAWLAVNILLIRRKQRFLAAFPHETTDPFTLAFGFTESMKADPAIRRLRFWGRFLMVWPFALFGLMTLIFSLFPVFTGS